MTRRSLRLRTVILAAVCVLLALGSQARADLSRGPQVPVLLQQLRERDHFDTTQIQAVRDALRGATLLPGLIRPAPRRIFTPPPWADYRRRVVNPRNIRHGLAFMRANRYWLDKAEWTYGVPPAVVTAILGIESHYGRNAGHLPTLDVLATLAFHDPRRHAFFFSELRQFFVLCRDEGFDPLHLRGSYAGAIGDAQFMPSNYLRFGVDFDGAGKVDLWSAPDAIGSIANYLAHFDPRRRWQRGLPLIVRARALGRIPSAVTVDGAYPNTDAASLWDFGIHPAGALSVPGDLAAGFVHLVGAGPWPADWIALPNFYSIVAYNPSILYAMAVSQLARALGRGQPPGS